MIDISRVTPCVQVSNVIPDAQKEGESLGAHDAHDLVVGTARRALDIRIRGHDGTCQNVLVVREGNCAAGATSHGQARTPHLGIRRAERSNRQRDVSVRA